MRAGDPLWHACCAYSLASSPGNVMSSVALLAVADMIVFGKTDADLFLALNPVGILSCSSGTGEMGAYAEDCYFADPFAGFKGTDRFVKNVRNLGGML